jgi:hypothetical protein
VSGLGIVVLVAGILLFIALLFALILIPVSRRAKRLRAELEAELGSAIERIENVRGLGLESRGASQTRGNGWLVLTAGELRFRQWIPDRETRVARADVTAVETPKSWLGKSVGTRLLCVRWSGDAMAWEVRDLDAWLAALSSDPRA